MRRKTYSEAVLEDLHWQINYWQGQARILRKERDDEKNRNDVLTEQFEKLVGETEEKNAIIESLKRRLQKMEQGGLE